MNTQHSLLKTTTNTHRQTHTLRCTPISSPFTLFYWSVPNLIAFCFTPATGCASLTFPATTYTYKNTCTDPFCSWLCLHFIHTHIDMNPLKFRPDPCLLSFYLVLCHLSLLTWLHYFTLWSSLLYVLLLLCNFSIFHSRLFIVLTEIIYLYLIHQLLIVQVKCKWSDKTNQTRNWKSLKT